MLRAPAARVDRGSPARPRHGTPGALVRGRAFAGLLELCSPKGHSVHQWESLAAKMSTWAQKRLEDLRELATLSARPTNVSIHQSSEARPISTLAGRACCARLAAGALRLYRVRQQNRLIV